MGTTLAQLATLRLLRGSFGALAFAARLYLGTQLAIFCVLMPFSLSESKYYLPVYVLLSTANFVVEIVVLLGLFQELSPDMSYGSVRAWGFLCLFISAIVTSMVLLKPPAHLSLLGRFYLSMDQVFTVFRNAGLFAVFFKGLLSGSSWPRRVSFVWLGMAIYSLLDFAQQRIELIHSFKFHSILQFVPPIALLVMLALWGFALYVPRRIPLVAFVPHQEKHPA